MKEDDTLNAKDKGQVVVSWTGGKDGCFCCYEAMKDGYKVTHILNFQNVLRTGSHEVNQDLIRAQADAVGIPHVRSDFTSYEVEFKKVIKELRKSGCRIDGAVFGHILTHKNLVDRICGELDLELIMPIWNRSSDEIINEVIEAGFEVIVISAKAELMGPEWLGRTIDRTFLEELKKHNDKIDVCGELGEFHTFVIDGPIFKKRLRIKESKPVLKAGYWMLDVKDFVVEDKNDTFKAQGVANA